LIQDNPTSSTGCILRFWPAKDRVDVHNSEKLSLGSRIQKGDHHVIFVIFHPPIAMSAPFARSVAIAALMGATMLASPLTAARADTAANAVIQLAQAAAPQNPAATGATEGRGETVEQRITTLHTALKITPGQEPLWNAVAQAMRENATAMDKIVAQARTTPPQNMTAVEDLNMYQKFAQAHIDGLKNLIVSFEKLYAAMPDAQKKITDDVFRTSGRQG
jgi:periplasmic protein CpxP/Spy